MYLKGIQELRTEIAELEAKEDKPIQFKEGETRCPITMEVCEMDKRLCNTTCYLEQGKFKMTTPIQIT